MNEVIVCTTIYDTPEPQAYAAMDGWDLVVVGDKRTPETKPDNAIVLTPDDQAKLPYAVCDVLPWNSIQRRTSAMSLRFDTRQTSSPRLITITLQCTPLKIASFERLAAYLLLHEVGHVQLGPLARWYRRARPTPEAPSHPKPIESCRSKQSRSHVL